jgi:hypothetical protein
VPIHCPICPKTDPTIWKYFLRVHFEEKHKTLDLTKYEQLWKLTNFEVCEMKKIWAKRGKVTIKRAKKSKIPLVISENHRARIPTMYVCFLILLQQVRGNKPFNSGIDEHLSKSPSPEVVNVAEANIDDEDMHGDGETQGPSTSPSPDSEVDEDAEKTDNSNEDMPGDLESGDFGRERNDVNGVIRKEAGGDCGRMGDAAVVENLESVPITQGDSINDGAAVSTVINKSVVYLQY